MTIKNLEKALTAVKNYRPATSEEFVVRTLLIEALHDSYDRTLETEINSCIDALNEIVDSDTPTDHAINICIDNKTFNFFDHAALINGLLMAMSEFKSEL